MDEISLFGKIGYQVSLTHDGTIYFSSEREGGFGAKDLYRSTFIDGKFSPPENLGTTINSDMWEESVYVSPDESFILFRRNSRTEDDVISDFFISRKNNNLWSEPVLITDRLGASGNGMWIGMSPDQKNIFFS